MDATADIAVIGAGFSGTLLALHLLRRCPRSTRVTLIERNGQFGRGQAYATGNPGHLLNVPAGRMSAFPDRPADFLDWLRAQEDGTAAERAAEPGSFVPRRRFGDYVRQLLNEEIKQDGGDRLVLVRGTALALEDGDRLRVLLDRDRAVEADAVVLAIGNFPPEPPAVADPGFYDSDRYAPDPWAPDALAGLAPADPVLLIGTGLTAVDTVISLLDAGHTGPIHAVSRRGLLPQRHAPAVPGSAHGSAPGSASSSAHGAGDAPDYPARPLALLRLLRARARAAPGGDWRPVVDALRPVTAALWQAMPRQEKARFLRHLRPWWDVHRHRMAPAVAARIEAAREAGQLHVRAGRIRGYRTTPGGVEVTYRLRGGDGLASLRAARVVNCSGPTCDYDRVADPLVRSLLANGQVRPDPLRLGLEVTAPEALVARDGTPSSRLFAVGPVTRGLFWEMTAVPDIRRQAEELAIHLAAQVCRAGQAPAGQGSLAAT